MNPQFDYFSPLHPCVSSFMTAFIFLTGLDLTWACLIFLQPFFLRFECEEGDKAAAPCKSQRAPCTFELLSFFGQLAECSNPAIQNT